MNQREARLLLLLPLLTTAAPLAGERPVLVCRGHEPEWSLRIDGSAATLATLGAQGLVQTGLTGRLQEIDWARPPFLVYRGRAEASAADLVAVITRETCLDTMADAAEGGGPPPRPVSLPPGRATGLLRGATSAGGDRPCAPVAPSAVAPPVSQPTRLPQPAGARSRPRLPTAGFPSTGRETRV
jgi:hypothetical protein